MAEDQKQDKKENYSTPKLSKIQSTIQKHKTQFINNFMGKDKNNKPHYQWNFQKRKNNNNNTKDNFKMKYFRQQISVPTQNIQPTAFLANRPNLINNKPNKSKNQPCPEMNTSQILTTKWENPSPIKCKISSANCHN